MKYGKFDDNALVIAPNKLNGDGTIVYNPPEDMYRAQGWKPIVHTDPPENPPEGYFYQSGWSETSDEIVQTWTLVEDPDDIDEAEAFDIIFGGDGE